MPYDSNIDSISRWLDECIDEIGWDLPAGPASTIGEAAMDVIVDGIQARARVQQGDDVEWPDNSPTYADEKFETYGATEVNVRTGQMLSRESLKGQATIDKETVEWGYGTGTVSVKAKTKQDREVTDIEKAYFAHHGQSRKRIERPFFSLDDVDADNVVLVVESGIAEHFERKASTP